eukprot:CAMPEP_0196585534 /NCGR_PEP_ID=MMETSP1081-20130531/51020_1 /TAXON_ID=36882 /ORGANISM="Pyramimonas amylifera, Strain CCMP720" /LENGTH=759 /DNA_ID=CAMNT_0041907117 /DNA_START=492 /DNA_END=2771 /DNA_ORIENTATION=+
MTGKIKGSDSWKYMARFCFLPSDTATGKDVKGALKATFKFRQDSSMTLMEYLERSGDYPGQNVQSFDSWKEVYSGNYNCSTRMANGMAFPLWDPSLVNACKRVFFRGRVGSNSIINGIWEPYTDPLGIETFGGRRIYAKMNGNERIFMFFKGDSGIWYIAKEVGSASVVAQAFSQAISPDSTDGLWSVADGAESFIADPLLEAVCIDNMEAGQTPDSFFLSPPPPPPIVDANSDIKGNTPSAESNVVTIKGFNERVSTGLLPDANGYVTAERTQYFVDSKARWIFLVLANCDEQCAQAGGSMCQGPLDVSYTLELTNGEGWTIHHFSADEIGILETEFVFFALQSVLCVFSVFVRMKLMLIHKFHHTVKLLLCSIYLTFMANFFDLIHYCKYASDGEGVPGLHTISMWLSGLAETLLLLLIILVAKGWSICCRKLSATGRVKISIYTTLYITSITGLLFWYAYALSEAEVVFIYHSAPGYFLCCMRVAGVVWLCYSTYVTLVKFRTKRRFFKKFVALYSVWLMALPFIVLVSLGIPTWIRAKVVNALELSFTFLAQAITLALYYPGPYNRSFPFHATTQDMMPRQPTRRVITKSDVPESAENDKNDEDTLRNQTFGNTRTVTNVIAGGRLERAALRSALELALRMSSDVASLKGALESLEATTDGLQEDLDEDNDDHFRSNAPFQTFSRPGIFNRAAAYTSNNGTRADNLNTVASNNGLSSGFGNPAIVQRPIEMSRNVSASQERSYIGRNSNAFSALP